MYLRVGGMEEGVGGCSVVGSWGVRNICFGQLATNLFWKRTATGSTSGSRSQVKQNETQRSTN